MNKKLRPDVLRDNAAKMPVKRAKVIDTQGGGAKSCPSVPTKMARPCKGPNLC